MLLIHEISRKTNIPIHTIRYYEKYGLFKGKKNASVKSNNYTYYDDDIVEKLELINEAKVIGFTLAEIKELLDAWQSKRLSKEKKIEVLKSKITEVDIKIQQLKDMKKLILQGIKEVEQNDC